MVQGGEGVSLRTINSTGTRTAIMYTYWSSIIGVLLLRDTAVQALILLLNNTYSTW